MNTCKNCKSWHQKFSICENAEMLYDGEKCQDDGMAIQAIVHDDSGLIVELQTGPNFGCINFKSNIPTLPL